MIDDFELFQQEFKKWQERFGLGGYKVYFRLKPKDGVYANIVMDQESMVATVTLSTKLDKDALVDKDIYKTAKHEAIHLLLFRLVNLAWGRFVRKEEIDATEEELVNKLTELIS